MYWPACDGADRNVCTGHDLDPNSNNVQRWQEVEGQMKDTAVCHQHTKVVSISYDILSTLENKWTTGCLQSTPLNIYTTQKFSEELIPVTAKLTKPKYDITILLWGFPSRMAYLYNDIEGFQPEWCISTIYHAWDIPFWQETLDLFHLLPHLDTTQRN